MGGHSDVPKLLQDFGLQSAALESVQKQQESRKGTLNELLPAGFGINTILPEPVPETASVPLTEAQSPAVLEVPQEGVGGGALAAQPFESELGEAAPRPQSFLGSQLERSLSSEGKQKFLKEVGSPKLADQYAEAFAGFSGGSETLDVSSLHRGSSGPHGRRQATDFRDRAGDVKEYFDSLEGADALARAGLRAEHWAFTPRHAHLEPVGSRKGKFGNYGQYFVPRDWKELGRADRDRLESDYREAGFSSPLQVVEWLGRQTPETQESLRDLTVLRGANLAGKRQWANWWEAHR